MRESPSTETLSDAPVFTAGGFSPGMLIGDYEVLTLLGEGGSGVVLGARHPTLERRVAIKVLHPELCADREQVSRFVQEARLISTIAHPNIVGVVDLGVLDDGRRYMVMDWLEGESLAARTARAPLAGAEAAEVLVQIIAALEAAHDARVIHRDLKPENVFLVAGLALHAKLLDFGLAKLDDDDGRRLAATRTGSLLGTPAYIAPEQARGRAVEVRTDVYALGAVAFELFTGQVPFPSDNAADAIAAHLYAPVPKARELRRELPAALEALIGRMLAKDAAARPSLVEVRAALAQLAPQLAALGPARPPARPSVAVAVTPPSRTRPARRAWGFAVAAAVSAGVAIAVFVAAGRERAVAPAPRAASGAAEPAGAPSPAPQPALVARPLAAEPEPARDGRLTVHVRAAAAAQVWIDGVALALDADGRGSREVGAGPHEIRATAAGHDPLRTTVEVAPGEAVQVPLQLVARRGRRSVGEPVGVAPPPPPAPAPPPAAAPPVGGGDPGDDLKAPP